MKIVSQDENRLVAHQSAVGGYIGGAIFAVIGVVVSIGLMASHQLTGALFGLIPVAVGVLLIVSSKARTLTIDKGGAR